jgi:radical SAM protein (TIGR01212 family)
MRRAREKTDGADILRATQAWGFRSYRSHLAERFPGQRVRKLCLDAGFTCPNLDGSAGRGGCTYCNNRAFAPASRKESLLEQWHAGRKRLRRRHRQVDGFIAYFQAFSNTYASPESLEQLYALLPQAFPECVGVAIGTRPDCVPDAALDIVASLARRTFVTLELGLQSDRDEVLRSIGRGHDLACFLDAVRRSAGRGFELCMHVMLGLPGEGADAAARLGQLAASLPVQSVKVHNLHVVRGTAMALAWRQGLIATPSRARYLEQVVDLVRRLRPDQSLQRLIADAPSRLLLSEPWCHEKQPFLADVAARLASDSPRALTGC